MRKLFTIGFLAALGLAGSVQAALQDGNYEVSAKGNNGPVVFSVEIQGQAIKSIKVVRGEETPGLGVEAIAMIYKEIIARQTTAVDAVSGATNSSRAVTAAVEAALQKAGGTAADLKKAHQTDAALPINNSTDVLVVGAGGAGMGAAIAAKEAGAKVLLIEKLPLVGGTTVLASTAFNAGGSKVQMSSAKPYTAADYYAKLEKGARGQELANVKQLADLSGPTADWLIGMGADLSRVINGSQHTPKDGGALGIETRTDTKATDLIVGTDGRVSGVRVTTPKGSYEIHAKAVILAAGGFASNPDLVKRFSPQWAGYPSTASVGATGDGIIMAEKAGAALSQMDLTGPQTVAYDTGHGAVSLTNVRYNGAILVNQEGKRFANELGQTAALASAITKQTGGVAYLIFDQKAVDHAALMQAYKARGYFVEAPNLTDLAAKLGINPQALGATVTQWHTVYDTKKDPVFGRKDSIFTRIDTAPYYGQKISPASQTTYGGVMRDAKSRAVRADGSVIPGLYVAGETASQFGSGVTIAVVLGRLAGTEAAKEVEAK